MTGQDGRGNDVIGAFETESAIPGDIDGSGEVAQTNVVLMLKVLMEESEQITFPPGNDVGGDDQIPLEEVLYNLQELGASE